MSEHNKLIKKAADILAIILIVMIFGGILGATELLDSLTGGEKQDTVTESMTFSVNSTEDLDIEAIAADITVINDESLRVDYDPESFNVKNKDGKISVKEKENPFNLNKSRKLVLYLPEDFSFKKAEIECGASDISGDILRCEQLELDTGAGEIIFENLYATKKAEVDCGAGLFSIKNGTLSNLDFSLGAGKAEITARVIDKAKLESGVGELKLTLLSGKENYTFSLEIGLGTFTFDGSPIKGDTHIGSGANKIDIEGGVGGIQIEFAD